MSKPISYMRLSNAISELLIDGYPTVQQTANHLGISVRSLRRGLHELEFTYTEIVEDVRCGQACLLLKDPEVSVAKTAVLLGYKNPSSFSCAFERWMYVAPLTYRLRYQFKGDVF